MTGHKAIVVGAGIGGLTAAVALRRAGWRVDVYERAERIAPVGAGVGIAPNAVKALRYLGFADELRRRGRRQTGLAIRLASGRTLVNFAAEGIEERYGASFYALHRAELHRMLLGGLDVGTVHTGHEAVDVDGESGTVRFVAPHGESSVSGDLVVVADGVSSRNRQRLFPEYPGPDYAGYIVWRGIVAAERAASLRMPAVLSESWGSGARFGMAAINDGQIYWFACENVAEYENPRPNLGLVAERFGGWHEPIPALLSATEPETMLSHAVYYLRARLPSFVRERAVLLGDAAHAVTPDIGQGACLAIEDAVVLAASIDRAGIDAGLREYDAVRRPRTQAMARASGRLGRLVQNRNRAVTTVRDAMAAAVPAPLLLRSVGSAFAWEPPRSGG
ncbi:FAD-dependent monooxygenase [Stackebrandtia nassauensis]|uniref:Monooxygenase FAD-binding protein n=1 Tax=Stackebrandtia nassauensis (strain DSM 44728 / CIP 108903 / NRRL B-16338 / NBRC 102104 / LLR-40K-21) TaxID=446470 RepID=D3PUS9_STANL|nr:FAD-dependent monooxygenase [Stackebrandtia nassauensis]ADD44953.1 monooxygenase FAD-binding protein [Stackebrandtia nassauensis DSM 44728]